MLIIIETSLCHINNLLSKKMNYLLIGKINKPLSWCIQNREKLRWRLQYLVLLQNSVRSKSINKKP